MVDGHVDLGEPGGGEQVCGCRDDGVEAEHLPDEPGVEGAGVGVAGEAVGCVFEAGRGLC